LLATSRSVTEITNESTALATHTLAISLQTCHTTGLMSRAARKEFLYDYQHHASFREGRRHDEA
jgi:hypothetical protein